MGETRSFKELTQQKKESIESIDHRNKKESMVYRDAKYSFTLQDNSSRRQYRQRAIAERLLKMFGEPQSWKFYLKCAYSLSEDKIWELAEIASREGIKKHNNYFVKSATNEMAKG